MTSTDRTEAARQQVEPTDEEQQPCPQCGQPDSYDHQVRGHGRGKEDN